MKYFCVAMVAVLLTAIGGIPIVAQIKSTQTENCKVTVNTQVIKKGETELLLRFTVENLSSEGVFIVTDPIQSNGKKGPYLNLESDGSHLTVNILVYPDPTFYMYTDRTSVQLRKLLPGRSIVEEMSIKFPVKETSPPWRQLRQQINLSDIHLVSIVIGYFAENDLVNARLDTRLKGSSIFEGTDGKVRRLIDVQRLTSSQIKVDG